MESILIVGGTKEERKQKAIAIVQKYKISPFDRLVLEPESPARYIGIDQIRTLRGRLVLRPFNSTYKMALLLDFEKSTEEAQNAFLKTLEEPPRNTIIVLTSPNMDLLLPTIVSRCQIISLPTTVYGLPKDQLSIANSQFSILLNGGVGERLKLAESMGKTRENAISGLTDMIIAGRQNLIDKVLKDDADYLTSQYLNILISLQKTHTLVSTTNVSPRLTLENCFLRIKLI